MHRRMMSALGALTMFLAALPQPALAAPPIPDYQPGLVSESIRNMAATQEAISNSPEEVAPAEAVPADSTSCITDSKKFLVLDDTNPSFPYFFDFFYLMAESDGAQVWVQADLSWPAGDPRATPVITCDQAAYMVGQFDNTIYPTEIDFFGAPDAHDGSASLLDQWGNVDPGYYADPAGRQLILVENVEDANYYDYNYPIYIAGFYSSALEAYFDRNTMTIDAYDWENRTGPDSTRPFLYEGVFAHEYQHLLHADYDPDEENFINEGMSDFAMFLVGYEVALTGHLDSAASNPENSLTIWEDQGDLEILTDYGQAALFQMYLYEQYGQTFTQALFHEQANGISGIQATLDAFGAHRDFADVYHDFAVAMLIDSRSPGDRYQFQNLDFKLDIGTPSAPNPEAFNTPGAPPWGTDYIWITGNPKKFAKLTFNGIDYSTFPTSWTSDGSVLWGGNGDLLDNWAIFEATGGGNLTFDTRYNIEDTWDFGFVQVSTDGGYTWTSLSNASTTDLHDPGAHPTVIANLPGLTGSTGGNWVNMSFDLSAYAGQDILLAFRYVTDWAFTPEGSTSGWFIDNVAVNGNLISDGSDISVFKDITEVVPINNDFTVQVVGQKGTGRRVQYRVVTMRLNQDTEEGQVQLRNLLNWCDSAVMMVTFDSPEAARYYADYTYEVTYKITKPRPHRPVHGHGSGTHFNHGFGHGWGGHH